MTTPEWKLRTLSHLRGRASELCQEILALDTAAKRSYFDPRDRPDARLRHALEQYLESPESELLALASWAVSELARGDSRPATLRDALAKLEEECRKVRQF